MFITREVGHQSVYGYICRNALANGVRPRIQVRDDEHIPYTKRGFIYEDRKLDLKANSKNFLNIIKEKLPEDMPERAERDIRDAVRPFDPFDVRQEEYFLRKNFRYCPECIKEGYHSVYTRLILRSECEIHRGTPLRSGCPYCGAKMENYIDMEARPGFICTSCGQEISGIKEPELLLRNIYNDDTDYPRIISKAPETDLKAVIGCTDREYRYIDCNAVLAFLSGYLYEGLRPVPSVSVPKNWSEYINPYRHNYGDVCAMYTESMRQFRMMPDYTNMRNFYTTFLSSFRSMGITSSQLKSALAAIYYQEYFLLSDIYLRREQVEEDEVVNFVSRLLWPQLEYWYMLIETPDAYDMYIYRYAALPSEDGLSMEPFVDVTGSITHPDPIILPAPAQVC